MVNILSFIGLVVIIKFCIKRRRMFMNKKAFFESVHKLRSYLSSGFYDSSNRVLDDIVHNVLGEEMDIEESEKDLVAHIASHIRTIKAAKEDEKLNAKAVKVIDQIKAMLDED